MIQSEESAEEKTNLLQSREKDGVDGGVLLDTEILLGFLEGSAEGD